jgi:hypothetical protein
MMDLISTDNKSPDVWADIYECDSIIEKRILNAYKVAYAKGVDDLKANLDKLVSFKIDIIDGFIDTYGLPSMYFIYSKHKDVLFHVACNIEIALFRYKTSDSK